jgi:hypothetical protein
MDPRFKSYAQAGPAGNPPSKPPVELGIPAFDFILQPDMSQLWPMVIQSAKSNFGLMLIIAAQVFFAIINLLVKKLHTIDPPVGTLQVAFVHFSVQRVSD